ncbi:MAG: MBL fold metallo-hydrolase [Ardenticatenaceae bacterium]|nr:MBL fold metallo-hydrolase [Anaerolineales bacterium]MCB8938967.1 MBL fold metallo-hydrolase [Ardenticatenaceae bacterium]MCB8974723.1 MBL fold metallo-hydrolase [Ardenticatenaceae bacterium]
MLTFRDDSVTAVILGNMQDAGLPHAGCTCGRCTAAFQNPAREGYAACLAIVDTRGKKRNTEGHGRGTEFHGDKARVYLVDATPDIKFQLNLLAGVLGEHPQRTNRMRQPDAIFLTHAHMGHIGGLPQLSKEAMFVNGLPLYATPPLCGLIQQTKLWSPLVAELDFRPMPSGAAVTLGEGLVVTAVPVPHRDEWGVGTVAYRIQGPNQSLLYLPDIDSWDEWPEAEATLSSVDVALVDASFYSRDELGGRAPVAHPLVTDTISRFAHLADRLVLTHLNHTNVVLDEGGGAETAVHQAGFRIAQIGDQFIL